MKTAQNTLKLQALINSMRNNEHTDLEFTGFITSEIIRDLSVVFGEFKVATSQPSYADPSLNGKAVIFNVGGHIKKVTLTTVNMFGKFTQVTVNEV